MLFPAEQPILLRALDIRPIDHHGTPSYALHDPLRLAEGYLIVPRDLGPLLALFDGSQNYGELRDLLANEIGQEQGPAILDQILHALNQALLLDNDEYRHVLAQARQEYHHDTARLPALAGISYPEDPQELGRMFDDLLADVGDLQPSPADSVAIFSPHIDYPRGGPIYAQVWKQAALAAQAAEVVLLLATDHYSPEPFTLTRQAYATPLGVLPTDQAIVDQLAAAIGAEAFTAELYHRQEHSVELVATWLHHIRAGKPCILVPVLCGSFARYSRGDDDPADNRQISALVQALAEVARQRRTLIVVSGDLAHVGPAFGGRALDDAAEQRLYADDQQVLQALASGDPAHFMAVLQKLKDRNNVCGLPPGYMALRTLELLGGAHGTLTGYQRCPADNQNRSAVTIGGMVFEQRRDAHVGS
ncbi:MAG: AmmeMemoRadiSam system protein B [Roseiflexaceae bacterium]